MLERLLFLLLAEFPGLSPHSTGKRKMTDGPAYHSRTLGKSQGGICKWEHSTPGRVIDFSRRLHRSGSREVTGPS